MGAPGSVAVSGLKKLGLDHLLEAIDAALVADPVIEMQFRLPQSEGAVLAALEAGAIVEGKRFEGNLAYRHRPRAGVAAEPVSGGFANEPESRIAKLRAHSSKLALN